MMCREQGMCERTLMTAAARSCPLLWRCYVEAELSFGRPQAARRVFLRAIHECPGSQVTNLTCVVNPRAVGCRLIVTASIKNLLDLFRARTCSECLAYISVPAATL